MKLSAALQQLRADATGSTAFYAGIVRGFNKVLQGKREKKVMLVISDGEDSSFERVTYAALREWRTAGVLIYGLGIREPRGLTQAPQNPAPGRKPPLPGPIPFPIPRPSPYPLPPATDVHITFLEHLAEISGGRAFALDREGTHTQMQNDIDQIADELQHQYSLGYYAPHDLKDRKWHSIEVRTNNPQLTVRARHEYFGE